MRRLIALACTLAPLLSACTFKVDFTAVDAASADDLAMMEAGPPPPDLAMKEGGPPPDLALLDGPLDLAMPDLAVPMPDLRMPDLAMPDIAVPPVPDIAMLPMPDIAMPPPDLALPDLAMPDLVTPPPMIKLSLDARSPSVWKALAQSYLGGNSIGHYQFDEMSGSLLDVSGQGNHLAPVKNSFTGVRQLFTPLPTMNGWKRFAYEFTGANGFAAAGKNVLDVTTQDFTIEAWFKLPPGYAPASCDPIVTKSQGAAGYQVCVTSTGKLQMSITSNGATKSIGTSASFTDGAWHLAAFVFKTSAPNAASILVDGKDMTGGQSDLSLMGGALANNGVFTVGGDGMTSFRGALAEIAFYDGRVMSAADLAADYRAFLPPTVTPAPASADLTWNHTSTLCTTVAVDPMLGERVACYAGGKGLPPQFPLTYLAGADANGNPEKLGALSAPAGMNYVLRSEEFNAWGGVGGGARANTTLSPRGDTTADSFTMAPTDYVFWQTAVTGNTTAVFSVWMRSSSSDTVTLHVIDFPAGQQKNVCAFMLSPQWKRYQCSGTITSGAQNNVRAQFEGTMGKTTSFDVWGAQLEVGSSAGPYVPNVNTIGGEPRGETTLSVGNRGFLDSGIGRIDVTFTGTAAMTDNSWFADTSPGTDRRYVRRANASAPEAEVLDNTGAGANDSKMLAPAVVDWTVPHALSLGWSSVNGLPMNAKHTSLTVDGMAPVYGRALPYTAAAVSTVHVGSDFTGKLQPAGAIHTFTIWSAP